MNRRSWLKTLFGAIAAPLITPLLPTIVEAVVPKPHPAQLGYKGREFWKSGIVYCPYIPVLVQRTVGPCEFGARIGMLNQYRFGKIEM